jgi:hypothetical protein
MIEHVAWLVYLGETEIALTKRLGFDHPKTVGVRKKFSDAYKQVQAVRRAYHLTPHQREN